MATSRLPEVCGLLGHLRGHHAELGTSGDGLGVDHEPGFALAAQRVVVLQVLAEQQRRVRRTAEPAQQPAGDLDGLCIGAPLTSATSPSAAPRPAPAVRRSSAGAGSPASVPIVSIDSAGTVITVIRPAGAVKRGSPDS